MKLTNEVKLGILVVVFFIILGLAVAFLGKLKFKEDGYILRVRFNFIGDLKIGAPVIFAGGIRVGKVIDIVAQKDKVEVILWLKKGFKIKKGNEILIYTQGLLGDKYVEINGYEGPGEYLKDGSVVDGTDPISLDAISIKLAKLMKGVFGPTLTDEEVKRSFASLFNNAGDFTYNLNMLIKENRANLYSIIKSMKTTTATLDRNLAEVLKQIKILSKNLGEISSESQKSINATIKSLETTSKRLNKTMKELENSSKNLAHITSAIKNRKGTIGKLIYEKSVYKNLNRTLKNLAIFSEKIKKNPKLLFFGK